MASSRHASRYGALLVPLALFACSGPETKVRDGLIKAGASPKLATCMAERMVDRLSLAQLQRLSRLSKSSGAQGVRADCGMLPPTRPSAAGG